MHFGQGRQGTASALGGEGAGGGFDCGGDSSSEGNSQAGAGGVEPVDEFLPCEDGGGGYGKIGFRFRSLLQGDGAAFFHQSPLQNADIGKLIREGTGTVGAEFAEVLNDAGMAPSEETVEVANFFVEGVVTFRGDGDDALRGAGFADGCGEGANFLVGGNSFAVGDARVLEGSGQIGIDIDAGDDERTEKVAFAAFVDPEMGFVEFGLEDFFIAKPRLAENLRFEEELDKMFRPFALDESFGALLVHGNRKFVAFGEEEHVGPGFEGIIVAFQSGFQLRGLLRGQRRIVKGDGFGGHRRKH